MNKADAGFCLGRAVVESKADQLHWAMECEKILRDGECDALRPAQGPINPHEQVALIIEAIEAGEVTKARQHLRTYLAICSNDWEALNR